jgi:hypothetical protein
MLPELEVPQREGGRVVAAKGVPFSSHQISQQFPGSGYVVE